MYIAILRDAAVRAPESLFSFAQFVEQSENSFVDCGNNELLEQYKSAWFELEIVNATALAEWESDGRPSEWDDKWKEMFKSEALDALSQLLVVVSKL